MRLWVADIYGKHLLNQDSVSAVKLSDDFLQNVKRNLAATNLDTLLHLYDDSYFEVNEKVQGSNNANMGAGAPPTFHKVNTQVNNRPLVPVPGGFDALGRSPPPKPNRSVKSKTDFKDYHNRYNNSNNGQPPPPQSQSQSQSSPQRDLKTIFDNFVSNPEQFKSFNNFLRSNDSNKLILAAFMLETKQYQDKAKKFTGQLKEYNGLLGTEKLIPVLQGWAQDLFSKFLFEGAPIRRMIYSEQAIEVAQAFSSQDVDR
eukprot:Pgem_evm1s5123